jgi:hypothetical protein
MSEQETPSGEGTGRIARGADLIIPALAVAFTIYFLFSVRGLAWEARANGTMIGIALFGLIAIQLGRIVVELRQGRADLSLRDLGEWSSVQVQRLAILLLLAVFVGVVRFTGTTLGLFLVMVASMLVLGVRSPKLLFGVAFATAATGYLLFIALLQTQFPEGPVEWGLTALFGVR